MQDVLAFMARPACSADEFDALALRLFAHQYQHNAAFQRFCLQRGKTARTVRTWRDIPAVPINAFKQLTLSCQAPASTDRIFMTSGTTQGEVKGRHYHPTLAVYDASMTRNFARRFMGDTAQISMGLLFPDEVALPNSSLAHYLALALREFGSAGSAYFINAQGLDVAGITAALRAAERSGQPYALLGASYSLVHVMDAWAQQGLRFALPPGSRVLDTGGFKGQSRDVPMQEFYEQLSRVLGLHKNQCINMYGMTELSTQFYDEGNATLPSVKSGPHWIKTRVVEPLTGVEVAVGERGVLVHCDLANFNSVTTILTEDVGVAVGAGVAGDATAAEAGDAAGGFLLLGRAQGAQAKGCSLAVEDFLRAARA